MTSEAGTQHIVFLDRSAIRVRLRTPSFAHTWVDFPHTEDALVVERLASASIAITNRVSIGADVLDAAPGLKLVAVSATGYDHVDIAACEACGVAVCNVRHWSISVPEHVFALTLALRRQLPAYRDALVAGCWENSPTYCALLEPMPRTLAGSTLGLIGYGMLARSVERIASAFGVAVLIAERRGATTVRPGRAAFDDVIRASDVLVVLCPLTDETRGLIGRAELAQMKRDALLINCARGGIVDEAALFEAVSSGRIGAATDVLSVEPPRNGNPLLTRPLPNLIVTPHVAWASVESLNELARVLIENIEAFVGGMPRNLVTRSGSAVQQA